MCDVHICYHPNMKQPFRYVTPRFQDCSSYSDVKYQTWQFLFILSGQWWLLFMMLWLKPEKRSSHVPYIYILRDWVKKTWKWTPVNNIFVVSIPTRLNNVFKQHIYQQAFYSIFRPDTGLLRDGGIYARLPAWRYSGAYRTVSGRPVLLCSFCLCAVFS